MARQATTLSQLVIRFYLSAPIKEVDALQPTLREIYNQRNAMREKIEAGKAKGKAVSAAATSTGKGKGKGKGKKSATAAFGGKEVVAGEASASQSIQV